MAHNSVSVHPESIILGQMTNVNLSFMWWCQFIDWLKFETRRSFPLNFGKANTDFQSCISLLAGGYCGFHRRKPVPSLIGCHLGFLRRALPGTSGRAQKSREAGGRRNPLSLFSRLPPPSPASPFCQLPFAPLLRVAYYPKWRPRKANKEKLQRLQVG